MPGREQSASGVPGRAGEERHVLKCGTLFATQGICSQEKVACALQYTREKEATV